jgi:hypothetical protein
MTPLMVAGLMAGMVGTAATASAAAREPLNAVAANVTYNLLFPPSAPLSVTVTDANTGAPVSGLFINFEGTSGNTPACTATTNQEGVATCTVTLSNPLFILDGLLTGYQAVFNGNTVYAPFDVTGSASIGL